MATSMYYLYMEVFVLLEIKIGSLRFGEAVWEKQLPFHERPPRNASCFPPHASLLPIKEPSSIYFNVLKKRKGDALPLFGAIFSMMVYILSGFVVQF